MTEMTERIMASAKMDCRRKRLTSRITHRMGIRFTRPLQVTFVLSKALCLEELCYRRRWVPEATEPARVSVSSARIAKVRTKMMIMTAPSISVSTRVTKGLPLF